MLSGLSAGEDPNLLVGVETSDDAAVYRVSDDIAMINTVDFITPPVDDPYWFGQISAANSNKPAQNMVFPLLITRSLWVRSVRRLSTTQKRSKRI